jgi:hypothetical protein
MTAGSASATRRQKLVLDVFDVEHGACALITTGGGNHILVDCGDNTTTGWEPGTALSPAASPHSGG